MTNTLTKERRDAIRAAEPSLLAAARELIAHWDETSGPEKRREFEGGEYWSPAGRMVSTEFIAELRAALDAAEAKMGAEPVADEAIDAAAKALHQSAQRRNRHLKAWMDLSAQQRLWFAADARAALTTAPPAAEPVKVKPLEWFQYERTEASWYANTVLGKYGAWCISGTGCYTVPGSGPGIIAGSTLEEAKAAAQAQYEARILSALTTSPEPSHE